MSVGFGFSAGDFIAALELVATVVDALRESGLASTQYRGLVSQLDLLETALRKVNRVELDDNQYAEGIALRQAAAQCRRTIEEFWKKNVKKYQPSLRAGGSGNGLRDGWMKIKWALCEKEDLAKFKTDLIGHTESINLLLTTIQMAATRIEGKKNEQYHKTLAGKVQDSYFGCMQRMSVVFEQVTTGIRHSKKLLKMTAEVIQTNVQIFQIVLDIQNLITRIPGQVERQQPVLLIDAIGRHAPFHLEFILSAEALVSVLQSNFKNIGSGARRIRDGKFAIQDLSTNRDVDLSAPWETCFHPGQRVEMSMVFRNCHKNFSFSCPKCRHSPGDDFGDTDKDIECPNCAMIYRRFSILPIQHFDDFSSPPVLVEDSRDIAPADEEVSPQPVIPFKRKLPYSDEEELTELALFRRVRLKSEWGRVPQHSQTPAQQLEQRRLIALLREIQNHDAARPFLLPLSIDDAGDYYDVIKEPMNLITMGQKLEDHCYQGPEDFVRDAKLIFNNCRKYYSETTPYAKSANRLEKFLWQQIRSIPEWQHLEP